MVLRRVEASWRRVAAAAARLAALYAVGVTGLFLLIGISLEGPPREIGDLEPLAAPVGVLFLIGFALLALARRAGFAALWLLLAGLWSWFLAHNLSDSWSRLAIPGMFVGWSVLALPLYGLGALGAPVARRLRLGPWRLSPALLLLAVWIPLIVAGIRQHGPVLDLPGHGARYGAVVAAVWLLWVPAPFLIAAFAVAGFWAGTRPASRPAPTA